MADKSVAKRLSIFCSEVNKSLAGSEGALN